MDRNPPISAYELHMDTIKLDFYVQFALPQPFVLINEKCLLLTEQSVDVNAPCSFILLSYNFTIKSAGT